MPPRNKPQVTDEGLENHLISLSYAAAEELISSGDAPSQLLIHFLRLGSQRAKLEAQKIRHENLLLEAKVEALRSETNIEKMYAAALSAMSIYSGETTDADEEF